MQGGHQQQAYDRGVTVFSPDGRLYQVEYAREAVKQGSAAVGIKTDEGVVLAVHTRTRSKLMESESVEKIHKADDHVGVATAGHVADARQLVDYARRIAQTEHLRYEEPGSVETITKAVTDHVQQTTQTGGARPYGASLLIAGVDQDGTARLFEAEPSGTPTEWKAVAVGGGKDRAQEHLEAGFEHDVDLDDTVTLAIEAIVETREDDEIAPDEVGVAVIDADERQFTELDTDAIADHLE